MPRVDVLLATGDFLRHGLSSSSSTYPENNWEDIKDALQDISNILSEYSEVVLPVIGNNDGVYHYQGANATWPLSGNDYYNEFATIWGISSFENGYYKHDLEDGISILGLNTNVWGERNDNALDIANT